MAIMCGIAAFGLVAGYVATRTRRLGPGIVGHAITNALGVVTLVVK